MLLRWPCDYSLLVRQVQLLLIHCLSNLINVLFLALAIFVLMTFYQNRWLVQCIGQFGSKIITKNMLGKKRRHNMSEFHSFLKFFGAAGLLLLRRNEGMLEVFLKLKLAEYQHRECYCSPYYITVEAIQLIALQPTYRKCVN